MSPTAAPPCLPDMEALIVADFDVEMSSATRLSWGASEQYSHLLTPHHPHTHLYELPIKQMYAHWSAPAECTVYVNITLRLELSHKYTRHTHNHTYTVRSKGSQQPAQNTSRPSIFCTLPGGKDSHSRCELATVKRAQFTDDTC